MALGSVSDALSLDGGCNVGQHCASGCGLAAAEAFADDPKRSEV